MFKHLTEKSGTASNKNYPEIIDNWLTHHDKYDSTSVW